MTVFYVIHLEIKATHVNSSNAAATAVQGS